MALPRPTLPELITRTEQDLASRLSLGQLIPRGPLAAIARVVAGACHLQFGRIDYEVAQVWPDTCDSSNLDRWGGLLTLPRKPAGPAGGLIVFAGTDGTVIALGTLVQRADGEQFATQVVSTVMGGAATVSVLAVTDGTLGNTPALAPLGLVSTVVGTITSVQVDANGLSGGVDQELDEPFRARLIQRLGNAPGSGTAADYERWALEVPGVTRAWPLPANQGPGTVGLTFVLDDDPVTPIPSATKVAEVQAYIDARRPEPVPVLVFAPVQVTVAFTIHVVPDTAEVRAAVAQSLADLFLREGGPSTTLPLSHLREAISLAPGETDHVLTVPASDLVLGGGQIPVVGTITWT
jgi:uncharacterized phage protein gp47/JayE